jgi:Capsule polysaccharide biosynthesis protein
MRQTPIKRIEIERPSNFDRQTDSRLSFELYASNIMSAARRRGLDVEIVSIPGKSYFAPRVAKPETVLFSFHSVGLSPHVFRIKPGYVKPYFTFDRLGYAGFSEIAVSSRLQQQSMKTSPASDRFATEFGKSFSEARVSKYRQTSKPDEDFGQYIFVPMQVDSDTVAALANFDLPSWLSAISYVAERSGKTVVAKRHPKCRSDYVTEFIAKNRNPRLVFANGSIFDLIGGAENVLVTNSGVGFEALAMGKKVISAGRSDYAFLTRQCSRVDDIMEALEKDMPASRREVNAFLNYYFNDLSFRIDSPADADRVVAKALSPAAWDLTEEVAWRGAEFGLSYFAFHQKMMDFAASGNSALYNRLRIWGLGALARRYARLK